ncbi:methyl-accepting chemotaxis protein [Primorskyibacter sp. 2E107]
MAVLLLSATGLYGLWKSELALESQITATRAIRHQMMADMMHEGLMANVAMAVLTGPEGTEQERDLRRETLAESVETFRSNVAALLDLDLPDAVRKQVNLTIPKVDNYLASAEQTADIAFGDAAAGRAALPAFQAQFDTLETDLGALGDMIQSHAVRTAETAREQDLMLIYVLLLLSILTTAGISYNVIKLTHSIVKPIERLRDALRTVAKGDFGIRIADDLRKDDIGMIARDVDSISERVVAALDEQTKSREEGEKVINQLGTGLRKISSGDLSHKIDRPFSDHYEALRVDFNETVDRLNTLLTEIVASSASIQSRANEMHDSSSELSSRTESQAATLEEAAAALEQMTTSVNAAATNAKEVEAVVVNARQDVSTSGQIVEEAISAMHQIETSSDKISQIIGVIDDIAFQTNLLALNAGVEAARAGDAGLGFAVVASEVRALAQRSSQSASQIKTLISDSSQHVKNGVDRVDSAGKALSSVVARVSQISDLVSGIARGSTEQAQGLEEINVGVSQLDQVTQQNAAMVDQSLSSIQVLNEETAGLNRLVGQFVLIGGKVSKPARPRLNAVTPNNAALVA